MPGTNDYFARALSALFEIQQWALANDCQPWHWSTLFRGEYVLICGPWAHKAV